MMIRSSRAAGQARPRKRRGQSWACAHSTTRIGRASAAGSSIWSGAKTLTVPGPNRKRRARVFRRYSILSTTSTGTVGRCWRWRRIATCSRGVKRKNAAKLTRRRMARQKQLMRQARHQRLAPGLTSEPERLKRFTPLPRSFYEPSAKVVAPQLLGHWLIRNTPQGPCGGAMVETEAYVSDDPACHGAPGPTPRNRVMFGAPGHGYVYLIYGYHFCFNAVCQPAGVAEAVLIRAIEPAFGEDFMRHERPVAPHKDLTNGPAKLCEALGIDRGLDGVDIFDQTSTLFIAENPNAQKVRRSKGPVVTTT